MDTITISASKARNNFFSLLDQVAQGTEVIIEKDHKEVAVLVAKKHKTDWKALLKATKESAGILKDYDPNDNPLRKPGAWGNWGKWDEDVVKDTKK